MDVYVDGIGMTEFGNLPDRSLKDLLIEACTQAIQESNQPKIDAVVVGNFMSGAVYNQEILGAIAANDLGLGPVPTLKVEGACASGGIALRQAILSVLSGEHDTVLVAGVEKMKHVPTSEVTEAINAAMDNESNEKHAGLTFPGFFGVLANRYFHETGASKEHLAMVALKNREHAMNNPLAQFTKATSINEIMQAKMITEPLGLFDCSPITDGAAAMVITRQPTNVRIAASTQASGVTQMQLIDDVLSLDAVKQSGKLAYDQSGFSPADMDVVEIHDCFSMTEIISSEELGFFAKGKGFEAVEASRTKSTGDIPINTSGGLLSRGHPIGATGIAQVYQIVQQLRGKAANQVNNAKVGLSQNLGGTGAYSVVHIMERVD